MPPKEIEDAVLTDAKVEIDLGLDARASTPVLKVDEAAVPASAAAGPRARFKRAVPPGRIASSEEAAAMLRGGIPADAGTAARLATRLAEISAANLVPETTDAQARAHLARRRGMSRGPYAGPDPLKIAAPAQARLAAPAQAALPGPVDNPGRPAAAVPVAYEPGARPGNLPAALGRRDVAATDPAWLSDAANQPRWWSVYDVPRYLQPMIRALGEQTFRSFPCFEDHREAAQQTGEDPLGSIRLLACLNGQPNTKGEIDVVASWIRDNGVIVAANQLAFPTMANYAPRVILAAHGDLSYLMVEETVATGAPCDARYVYAWKGGMDFYLSDRAALGAVRALRAPEDARIGIPGAPRAEPLPQVPFRVVTVDPAEERRKRTLHLKSLPQAEAKPVSSALLQEVRALGFKTVGTPDGPALRLDSGDNPVMLLPEPGLSLPLSGTLRARRLDADGTVLDEETVETVEDVERFLEQSHLPTP